MKKIIYISVICCSVICSVPMKAQNYIDAFNFSQNLYNMGTARSSAMGGAFGALGGDFSSLSINPGGIGVYRSSEFVFTPSLNYNQVNANYIGTKTSDYAINGNLNNIGYVYTGKTGQNDGLVSVSFAIGYNRLNDYNQNTTVSGYNPAGSISDMFYTYAQGNSPSNLNPYYEGLANQAGVINLVDTANNKWSPNMPYNHNYQQLTRTVTGNKGEWNFALGGNVSNKFYFGASLNIESIVYNNSSDFIEQTTATATNQVTNLLFHTSDHVQGTGLNLKLGGIYRPVDFLRIGLSYHTPTFYNFSDQFNSSMQSNLVNGTVYPVDANNIPLGASQTNYRLVTPMRLIGSLGFTINKIATIGFDAEYIDYSKMNFNGGNDGYAYTSENADIARDRKSVV